MKVNTTISLEVKMVRIDTIIYKKIKNLKLDPFDFANTLFAHKEKKPTLSRNIEIKEIDMNNIKILIGFITVEKSNNEISDSLETELVRIKMTAHINGTR